MSPIEWMVIGGGLLAIAAVNWWFFIAGRGATLAQPSEAGPQEIQIVVRGGYDPSRIRVRAGRPVRLVFDRQENAGCSEEVVFPDFGIRRFLAPFQRTTIELGPQRSGHYEFMCGMSMLHGTLEVE
jgi:plastocyanin domain-containing protein